MAHTLSQLQNIAWHDTIAHMEIITLIISSVSLLVSVAALYTVRSMSKAPSSPTVGTKGMGGGGR